MQVLDAVPMPAENLSIQTRCGMKNPPNDDTKGESTWFSTATPNCSCPTTPRSGKDRNKEEQINSILEVSKQHGRPPEPKHCNKAGAKAKAKGFNANKNRQYATPEKVPKPHGRPPEKSGNDKNWAGDAKAPVTIAFDSTAIDGREEIPTTHVRPPKSSGTDQNSVEVDTAPVSDDKNWAQVVAASVTIAPVPPALVGPHTAPVVDVKNQRNAKEAAAEHGEESKNTGNLACRFLVKNRDKAQNWTDGKHGKAKEVIMLNKLTNLANTLNDIENERCLDQG